MSMIGIVLYNAKTNCYLLEKIQKIGKRLPFKAVQLYKIIFQLNFRMNGAYTLILHVGYQAGSLIAVISWTGVVIGWGILEPSAYKVSLAVAFSFTFTTGLAIPIAVKTHEMSKNMLKEWKNRVQRFEKGSRAENSRVLRALRPMGYPIAMKGMLDKQLSIDIVTRIVFNTQDLVLLLKNLYL